MLAFARRFNFKYVIFNGFQSRKLKQRRTHQQQASDRNLSFCEPPKSWKLFFCRPLRSKLDLRPFSSASSSSFRPSPESPFWSTARGAWWFRGDCDWSQCCWRRERPRVGRWQGRTGWARYGCCTRRARRSRMSCSEIKIKLSESVKNLNLTVEYEYLNLTIWCAIFKAWNTVSVLIFNLLLL